MARHQKPPEPAPAPGGPGGDFDIQAWVDELIAGRDPAEIRDLLQGLLAAAPRAAGLTGEPGPAGRQAPPPQRRPRRPGSERDRGPVFDRRTRDTNARIYMGERKNS